MKKLFFILFLFVLSCVEKEVTPDQKIEWLGTTPLAPPEGWKPENETGRISTETCQDFKWWHDGTTYSQYIPSGSTHYNGFHWNVIVRPQWRDDGNPWGFPFVTYDNQRFGLRMYNTGQSTFRYRFNGGAWTTLTAGQNGTTVYFWVYTTNPICSKLGDVIGSLVYSVDIERLTCTGPIYNLVAELRTLSVAHGHNFGQPGYTIHANQLGITAEGSPGSCQAP